MPPSPRRSTRAAPASTTSSSLSSTRQDRNSRGAIPQKSATPRSISSEDISEPPRRSQRALQHKDDDLATAEETIEDADEEAVDEEEITRCICGHQEYPGPPLSEAFANIPDAQADDAGGLFILCDGCSVWQHGGCVGIVEEAQSPEKYFCEQCRPKLHALYTDSKGQNYSLYVPLHSKAGRKGSVSKSDKEAKRDRESVASRASVDPATGRRRGTMRSKEHDDEEEQLQRAIEESKRDAPGTTNGRRIGKRAREESEEGKQDTKRQRRASELAPRMVTTGSLEDDSDDAAIGSKGKRAKGETTLTARQVELSGKDKEKERARAEAANRRQERARGRRNDELDAAEQTTPKPTPSARASPPPPSSQPPSPPAEKATQKRGPGKKPGKKLGNNQYTKAKYEQSASSPHGRRKQLHVSGSGDEASESVANGETMENSTNGAGKQSPPAENGNGVGKGKFGRGKKAGVNGNWTKAQADAEPVERTFTNMHAALTQMSAYMARHGAELLESGINGDGSEAGLLGGAVQFPDMEGIEEKPIEELTAAQLAIKLQKGILSWQQQWGHLAGSNAVA